MTFLFLCNSGNRAYLCPSSSFTSYFGIGQCCIDSDHRTSILTCRCKGKNTHFHYNIYFCIVSTGSVTVFVQIKKRQHIEKLQQTGSLPKCKSCNSTGL